MISFRVTAGVVEYQISNDEGQVITKWSPLICSTPAGQLEYFLLRHGYKGLTFAPDLPK